MSVSLSEEQIRETIVEFCTAYDIPVATKKYTFDDLISALIGKCATEQKEITCKHGLVTCNVCKQKDYCECKEPKGQIKGSNPYEEPDICLTCRLPIPAEKKEKETCDYNMLGKCFWGERKGRIECFYVCPHYEPEPKPKDRIEGILKQDYSGQHKEIKDKINELAEGYKKIINFINYRKE
jgi:hypothetical protein